MVDTRKLVTGVRPCAMAATSALRNEVPGLFSVFYSLLILPLHHRRTKQRQMEPVT
jgi:hypothetical protein